jgi:hypothetical protein
VSSVFAYSLLMLCLTSMSPPLLGGTLDAASGLIVRAV